MRNVQKKSRKPLLAHRNAGSLKFYNGKTSESEAHQRHRRHNGHCGQDDEGDSQVIEGKISCDSYFAAKVWQS